MTEAEKHIRNRVIGEVAGALAGQLVKLSTEHKMCPSEVTQVVSILLQMAVAVEMEDHYISHDH